MGETNNNEEERDADDSVVEPDREQEQESEALADPAEQVKKLKERLRACERERKEYLSGWQRAKADYANARKDEERSRECFVQFANEELIRELLPALDSFHIAFGNKAAWDSVDLNWRMGVQHIYAQLSGALEPYGVSLIEPKVGEPFDPKKHASVGSLPVQKTEDDHTIASVVQKGFMLRGRVLQPAKVKVGEYKAAAGNENPPR